MGAGGASLTTQPAADYASERLSSEEEVINTLNRRHPGGERKPLRTAILARLTQLNTWAEAMLISLPKVLKKGSGVLAEYEAALLTAGMGGDPEYMRRATTRLGLYKPNYVVSLVMARAPGGQQAANQRAKDWVMASRGKQTDHEWRAKLTELGLQQQPPVGPEDRNRKERFITGSNLGAGRDPFREFVCGPTSRTKHCSWSRARLI